MRVILILGLLISSLWSLLPSRGAVPVTPKISRPRLLGVAKLTIRASDPVRSAGFYRDLLGFPEAGASGSGRLFQVNERQFVEVLPGLDPAQDRLLSVSLQTDQAEGMRRYLAGRGWKVPPAVAVDQRGHRTLRVADPEGRWLEFIEYANNGSPVKTTTGKGTPTSQISSGQISTRIMHAGIIVTNVPPALDFYNGVLGLREFWRGSGRDSKSLSWINMRLPESEDYLELMLYGEDPPGDRRGSAHHLCLEVADIGVALARLESNPARAGYTRPLEIRVGVNRRRQLNLFDPDGTRSELMEPRTIDGVPPVSSPAPYPER